ncbi:MAG: S8 family serine peptidase [Pyrinomonadaceae bacterium]
MRLYLRKTQYSLSLTVISLAAIICGGSFPQTVRASEAVRITRFAESVFSQSNRLLAADGKLSPEALADTAEGEKTELVVLLAEQADVSDAYSIEDQDERGWYVYRTLSNHAKTSQADLVGFLAARGIKFQSFWAANMIIAEIDRATAVAIAGRSDVARVDSNRPARWVETPEVAKAGVNASKPGTADAIEWGVTNVNAPSVWNLGFNGSGIVVGGLDTGVRWTHNAIKAKYRGWNGTTADHNYNWHDAIHSGGGVCGANTSEPCDDFGHGSHTVGTMVGDDGTGNQIGVAPGAKWIGCRNMNIGDGTPATYTECLQFMIAPTNLAGNNPDPSLRPHIINNSWGCPASEGCTTRAELETIINNTQAAGIFVQASAGNSGGAGCSSVSEALAIYDASFSTGAIDINNALVGFSSRGPSTYYTPNLLKPNLSAPGSNVRSITRTNDSAYTPMSGTSMASPHVAGVIALLWSARPALVRNIGATKALLQNTANPGVTVASQTCGGTPSTQIPNNIFGFGRVDALAAVNAVTVSGRVLTPEGVALRNAVVTLIDANNVRRTATTSSFGIFSFDGVRSSATATIAVSTKRYRFAPQIVSVGSGNLVVSDFVGLQ